MIQDSSASHDFIHYDSDPTPDYDYDEPNTHGTECAGIVGMTRNSYCGVGVAYDANIGCELHVYPCSTLHLTIVLVLSI